MVTLADVGMCFSCSVSASVGQFVACETTCGSVLFNGLEIESILMHSCKLQCFCQVSFSTTSDQLQEFASNAGEVIQEAVKRHEDTGESKGWG